MLKKQLEERILELEEENNGIRMVAERLHEQNETLQMYVNQLRGKLQEVSSNMVTYESSMLVMTSRLKELGGLISEQNVEKNRSE
jgi:regulator of replication initiation timing